MKLFKIIREHIIQLTDNEADWLVDVRLLRCAKTYPYKPSGFSCPLHYCY